MKTLSEAWDWYQSTRENLTRMRRLGRKHWADSSLKNASIWQDDEFRTLEASDIVSEVDDALGPLDDLAVIVLFSVFEAAVRDHLEAMMQPEADELIHPILRFWAEDAIEGVRTGSFATRVTDPLKDQGKITPDLAELVSQVRQYRNWVAHGKRPTRKKKQIEKVDAKEAYDRLKAFLDHLGIAVEPELESPRKSEHLED